MGDGSLGKLSDAPEGFRGLMTRSLGLGVGDDGGATRRPYTFACEFSR